MGRITVCACVLLVASGCSWISVRGPGPVTRGKPVDCTTSRAAPTTDAVVAVVGIGAFVASSVALALCDRDPERELACLGETIVFVVGGVPGGLIGGIYAASAATGYGRVAACREAQVAAALPLPPRQ